MTTQVIVCGVSVQIFLQCLSEIPSIPEVMEIFLILVQQVYLEGLPLKVKDHHQQHPAVEDLEVALKVEDTQL